MVPLAPTRTTHLDQAHQGPLVRKQALKDIDPWWNPAWPQAWQRMCARARAADTPLSLCPGPLPAEADDLTRWLDEQFDAFPALAKGQLTQLAALPLQHDPLALALHAPAGHKDTTHAHGLRAARRFYRRHQHLHVPAHYTDQEGGIRFPLGRWIADQRTRASENRLTREETESLQALAMEWAPGVRCDDTPAALPGPRPQTTSTKAPAPQPPHEHTRPAPVFRIACSDPPAGVPDIPFHGGSRILLTMPAWVEKTMTAAVAVHEAASPACLLLGPHTACLHQAVRTWRAVSKGPLAGLNTCPTCNGRAGVRLNGVAGELAAWMAQQPPGAMVVARHLDAALIADSHHLPPWEHLVVEEAHRTAEGVITQDHPHAAIHSDDGSPARTRPSLTATPPIPRELPALGDRQARIIWDVDMPAQPVFGTHHLTVQRRELVETGLLSPYQVPGDRRDRPALATQCVSIHVFLPGEHPGPFSPGYSTELGDLTP